MAFVYKADGTKELYDKEKILGSIRRAGVPKDLQQRTLRTVEAKLYDGIPTHDIYNIILKELSQSVQPFTKSRYSLKQAIMLLGPTGYPFEDYVAKIFEGRGYSAQTRQILNGRCVSHETDVILEKEDKKILIEAKFHNNPGTRSDIKVALYVKARFDDLKDKHKFDEIWVVTNTKTTIDANAYAGCVGLKIVSWNFPDSGSLREIIEEDNLYPITILMSLSADQKARLLGNHIVLCKDIYENKSLLDILLLTKEKAKEVLDEIRYICNNHKPQATSSTTEVLSPKHASL